MKRALITGITGQDGSYLAEFLIEKGYDVWGMVRRSSTDPLQRVRNIKEKLNLRYGNLLDSHSLMEILKESKPDEIYNLAAQSDVGISFKCPNETEEVNYHGVGRLIHCVEKLNLNSKIYQASTSEMFGNANVKVADEKTPFDPQSPYAEAKTNAHLDFVVNYRGRDNLFICSGFMFNHESPRRGKHFVTRKITNSMTKIKLGLQNSLSLGNLDSKRDWGFAKDYVKAMWLMLQQETPQDYVIATGESHTVRDFVNATGDYLETPIEWKGEGINEEGYCNGKRIIVIDARFFRPKEVHKLCGDASKAKKELGWEPEVKFKGLVKIMIENDLNLVHKDASFKI